MSENLTTYLAQIAAFLKVPAGKINLNSNMIPTRIQKNITTTGFINIVFTLLKESNHNLLGNGFEDEIEIRQWLEYYLVYVAYCQTVQNIHQILGELDSVLATRTYLVSHHLTIADVALYYFLQNLMGNLSYVDKEKFINVCRWFDNIQLNASIRQSNKIIDFSTNYLVTVAPGKH